MGRTNLWEELNCCIMLPGQEIPTAYYSDTLTSSVNIVRRIKREISGCLLLSGDAALPAVKPVAAAVSQEMSEIPFRSRLIGVGDNSSAVMQHPPSPSCHECRVTSQCSQLSVLRHETETLPVTGGSAGSREYFD